MPPLHVEVIETMEAAEAIAPSWDALAAASGATFSSRPAYGIAWYRHLGKGRLSVVTAHRGERLVAVGALHLRSVAGVEVVRWLGHGLGTVGELVVDRGDREAATAVWEAVTGPRRVLDLVEYRHGGEGLAALRRSADWDTHLVVHDLCPVVGLTGVQSIEELHRQALRKMLGRARRRLDNELSALCSTAVTGRAELDEILPEVTTLYARAEAANARLDLMASPWRAFTVELLRASAEAGRLVIMTGRIQGRLVCFDIGFIDGRRLSVWAGRFDPDLRRFSLGHLNLDAMLRWAIDHEMSVVDLLIGDTEYKRRWATSSYDTVAVVAATPGRLLPARALLGGRESLYQLRRRWRTGQP